MADAHRNEGKLADITGPGRTDRWGVTCIDLGASVIAPNGTLVSVFGDTFSGNRVDDEDHAGSRVAQLYGGYILPGSTLDVVGGIGLVVSQWNTMHGWPYRAMQFRATLRDTTRARHPKRESPSSGAPLI